MPNLIKAFVELGLFHSNNLTPFLVEILVELTLFSVIVYFTIGEDFTCLAVLSLSIKV